MKRKKVLKNEKWKKMYLKIHSIFKTLKNHFQNSKNPQKIFFDRLKKKSANLENFKLYHSVIVLLKKKRIWCLKVRNCKGIVKYLNFLITSSLSEEISNWRFNKNFLSKRKLRRFWTLKRREIFGIFLLHLFFLKVFLSLSIKKIQEKSFSSDFNLPKYS